MSSIQDREENIYNIICELRERIETLENENKEMKKTLIEITKNSSSQFRSFHNRVLNTLRLQPSPSISFIEWIDILLNNVESKLETVFQNDLLTGINSLLKDTIENLDNPPILAFHKRTNIFYYYDQENNNWTLLEDSEFDKILKKIDNRFLLEFNRCWYQVYKKKIQENSEYKDMYTAYYLKILGGEKMLDETRYKRIRHVFYNVIKQQV